MTLAQDIDRAHETADLDLEDGPTMPFFVSLPNEQRLIGYVSNYTEADAMLIMNAISAPKLSTVCTKAGNKAIVAHS